MKEIVVLAPLCAILRATFRAVGAQRSSGRHCFNRAVLLLILGSASPTAIRAGQIAIGDIYLSTLQNGTQQFYLDNFTTGASGGCAAPSGFPICTQLFISGTLNYSYDAGGGLVLGSATLVAPLGADGGASWAPPNFQFPSAYIFSSAIFSGTISPLTFSIDTNPGTMTFHSDGTAISTDVITDNGVLFTNSVPEPSSISLLILAGASLLFRVVIRRA